MKPNHAESMELEGTIVRETAKAILFKFEDENGIEREEWFPFSQVNQIHHDDPATIVVSKWIYNTKKQEWK